ncbi:MAG: hypothetical protein ACREML_06675 [Vulcanimicrobiaceae bacterium]
MRALARAVFGLSAIVGGVVDLIWHGSQAWQLAGAVPLGAPVAWCFALAQIAAGIGMLYSRTVRAASIILGLVYLVFTLQSAPRLFVAPLDPIPYVNMGEQFSLVCGAIAIFAPKVARIGLGICAISFAWAQVVYLEYTASLVPAWIPPNQVFWTNFTTFAFALAAIAMLLNFRARLAMNLMGLMVALFGVIVWVPHIIAKPGELSNWNEIATNYLIAGAALLVAR